MFPKKKLKLELVGQFMNPSDQSFGIINILLLESVIHNCNFASNISNLLFFNVRKKEYRKSNYSLTRDYRK